jgi:hypothetical protein
VSDDEPGAFLSAQPPALSPPQTAMVLHSPSGVQAVRETMETLKSIRTFIKEEFKKDLDFGTVPGTEKQTLLQPGAQKTAMYFNAAPHHQFQRFELGNGHVEFVVTTQLIHRATGAIIGSGVGSCTTMEKKYRYRDENRKCPLCGKESIYKSKQDRGGWYCWAKRGGCGAQFKDGEPSIVNQLVGRVENPDIADVRNTVLKMACKRSFVAASMSLGCLGELFTQDLDETYDLGAESPEPPRIDNNSGHGKGKYAGQYAPPALVEEFRKATIEFCKEQNALWLDEWTGPHGLPDEIGDILHPAQMTRHLLKWALRTGRLQEVPFTFNPETGEQTEAVSVEQAKKYVAILWGRDREALTKEAMQYTAQERHAAREEWRRTHPEGLSHAEDDEILRNEAGARG